MTAPDDRAIAFVGFMGAGKSAAARVVAEALGTEARDSDLAIEEEDGRPIADIFAVEGEAEFREHEERVVRELLDGRGGVVSLGGGAVETASVREALAGHVVVWCDVEREVAWERVSRNDRRPLGRDRAEFDRRFEARRPLYEEVATVALPSESRESARGAALCARRAARPSRPADGMGALALGPVPGGRGGGGDAAPVERIRPAPAGAVGLRSPTPPRWPRTRTWSRRARRRSSSRAGRSRRRSRRPTGSWQLLADAGARRDDGVIAFGGGVVGDLAGFCAADLPARDPGRAGPDHPRRPGRLRLRRQDRGRPAAGQELRRRLPPAAAVLADPATLATLPAGGGCRGIRRGREDRADRRRVAVGARARVAGARTRPTTRSSSPAREPSWRSWPRTSGTPGVAPSSTSATPSATRSRPRAATPAIATARPSGSGCSRRCASRGRRRAARGGRRRCSRATVCRRRSTPRSTRTRSSRRSAATRRRTAEGVGFVLAERPGEVRVGERVDEAAVRAAIAELRENPAA